MSWKPSLSETVNRRNVLKGAAAAGAGAAFATTLVPGSAAFAQDASPEASPAATGAQLDPTVNEPQQTFPLVSEPKSLKLTVASSAFVEDFTTNEFTAWLEEWTGVHIEWEVVPAADATERSAALNVRLASGEYGDAIMNFGPTPTVVQLYGEQGVFQPLNDLIDQHGVFTRRAFEEYPLAKQLATANDGNIYALPQVNDCYHCSMSQKLWINKQWLENLGLEMPTTTEEYAEVLRAFKTGDPNGNGKNDEFPLSGSTKAWHGSPDEYFMNSFIYHPGNKLRLIVVDGKVTPIYTQDAWREGTKYLAGLFKEGLIDPEIFTRDSDQLRQLGDGNGGPDVLLGSVAAGWWGEFTTYTSGADGVWQQFTAVPPLKGPEGVQWAGFNPFISTNLGTFLITDKCKDPELALKWADALGHIEATTRSIHGVKDRDWAWASEGETGINGKQAIWRSITNMANVPSQNVHWSQVGTSYRSNDYRLGQYVAPEEAPNAVEVILFNQTKEKYEPYKQPAEMALPTLYFSPDQAQTVAELTPTIQAYVDQTFAQAVTGQIDIEQAWSDYTSTLSGMGLDDFVAMHQDVFDASQG